MKAIYMYKKFSPRGIPRGPYIDYSSEIANPALAPESAAVAVIERNLILTSFLYYNI
jgi:hypothetical protein